MSCTKHTSFSTNEHSIDLNDKCSSAGLNRDDREDEDRGLAAQQTAAGHKHRLMADVTEKCRVRERNSEFELPALSIESRSGRGISQEQTLDPV